MGAPMNEAQKADSRARATQTKKDLKRAALAFFSMGTSEIKTGGGEYGDETLADAMFPKTINDWALDRNESRRQADLAKQAEADKLNRPGPDMADKLLQGSASNSLLRQQTKRGRRSTFLSGGYK